eukprot:TRINITY_DN6163_c0_g1_i5.p1 TRINITY_DN6163_c0_g1~~TRINITY_DN6163_c0_g1_i5.p1  ORF type:complete len:643 (-),score=64.68 TRINITY_DN6163_c0_g1_i5:273-2033(-)
MMFRTCAGGVCVCNMLTYWTSTSTSQSQIFARLALVFHAGTCYLAAQGSLFHLAVLWFAHAGLEIAYTWFYHCIVMPRTNSLPQMCFLTACLTCGGISRLVPSTSDTQVRRLAASDDQDDDTSNNVAVAIITMVVLVIGGLMIYGMSSLDHVRDHPTLFHTMDFLKRVCVMIWRRSCSCLDTLRQCFRKAKVEVYEPSGNSISREVDNVRAAHVLLSAVADTCRREDDLLQEAKLVRVANLIQVALNGKELFPSKSSEYLSRQSTDIGAHDTQSLGSSGAKNNAAASIDDVIFNIVETDSAPMDLEAGANEKSMFDGNNVLELSPMNIEVALDEERVPDVNPLVETLLSCNQVQVSQLEAQPSQNGSARASVPSDPMAALQELEEDAMCDCLMYSDSEDSDDGTKLVTAVKEERVPDVKPVEETSQSCSVQNTQVQASHLEAQPSENGTPRASVPSDLMAALQELEQDAMCDCLMYSDSEDSDDGANVVAAVKEERVPDVNGTNLVAAVKEECVPDVEPVEETSQSCTEQNAQVQVSHLEAQPSENGTPRASVPSDPMAALEELEQDAMCDCLMYSDSENSDDITL